MGHYSSHYDTNDGALFLLLTPMMRTIPPNGTNNGALFLPLISKIGHCSHSLMPGHFLLPL
ncbi:unnamed protein product, partial [Staurois parvus]